MRPTTDEIRAELRYRSPNGNGRNQYGIPVIPRQTRMSASVTVRGMLVGAAFALLLAALAWRLAS